MNFLFGILFMALGIALIKFRYQIYDFTGEWGWATKYLGGNGTVVAIILFGCFFMCLGAAYPFGVIDLSPNHEPTPTFNAWK